VLVILACGLALALHGFVSGALARVEKNHALLEDLLYRMQALQKKMQGATDINASEKIRRELLKTSDRIAQTERLYEAAVVKYNEKISKAPGSIIAGLFRYEPWDKEENPINLTPASNP